MSYLRTYKNPGSFTDCHEFSQIAEKMAAHGIQLEQWQAKTDIGPLASEDEIKEAYAESISRLKSERGFVTEDIVSITADTENHQAMRLKFLAEHTHRDDEARFFINGQGLFYIRHDDSVSLLLCEQGELINLPAGTKHWFDMGSKPSFQAIRVFLDPEGWVGHFTDSNIHLDYPDFDTFVASMQR